MTDDELKELVASLAVLQEETSNRIQKTEVQIKRIDEKLELIGIRVGNISKNQGDVAEDFFYQSLIKDNHLGDLYFDGITKEDVAEDFFYQSLIKDNHLGDLYFDDITKNMEKHRGNIQEEYDLFMTNGDSIAIVEVKYKAHKNDLDKLDRKMMNFKKLFPIYKDYKLYGALAAFHINDDAKEEIFNRGYFALQRSGDLVCSESKEHLKVL